MKTTKGKDLVQFDGFEYSKKGESVDGRTQFWACPLRDCPGRAHSVVGSEQLTVKTPHNHMRSVEQLVVRQRKEEVKTIAKQNANLPPREIYQTSRQHLSDDALLQMPSYSAMQRQIELQRELPGRKEVDAKELQNIVIDGDFSVDYNGQLFLLVDSRINAPDDVVYFIFCTARGLERLRSTAHWSADGTFKGSIYFLFSFPISFYL
jgi:hypothetical protein